MKSQEITLLPRLFGYFGLVPFVISSFFIWSPQYQYYALQSLSIYAAVILTFIGGVHWGIAMQTLQNTQQLDNAIRNQFIFSLIPSLLAWVAIVFLNPFALIILAVCFTLFWWIEKSYYQQHLPSWYMQLRNHLTLVVVLCIIFGWLGTL